MNDSKRLEMVWRWPRPAFVLLLGMVLGMGMGRPSDWPDAVACASSKNAASLRLMSEAWNAIYRHYVDRSALRSKELAYGAIEGMVDALGDTGHSTFLTPVMVKRLEETKEGRLQGIGVEVEMKGGQVVVVAPIDGSPAARAGLRHGDVIVKVDGRDIGNLPLSQTVTWITGKPGTTVKLTIADARSGATQEVAIVRAAIRLQSVTWNRLPGTSVAHLRIASFEEGTGQDVRKALTEIQREATSGIVLDLRNNPGGILDSAIQVASQFLKSGNVLLARDADGQTKPMPVEKGGVAPEVPLVVLVNGGSASGAEIVAGALRDAHRAALVGQTTFGTGTVLREFPLSDGSALLLAVQEWLTPSGHSFWHKGIAPDAAVALPAEAEMLVPHREQGLTSDQLQSSGDTQLLRGLAILTKQ
jgi:carboxyl-terminal processing protease